MVIISEHKSRGTFNVINTSERSTLGLEGSLSWYPGSKMFRKNARRRSDRYIIQRTSREEPRPIVSVRNPVFKGGVWPSRTELFVGRLLVRSRWLATGCGHISLEDTT